MSKLLQFFLRFWAKIYLKRAKPKIIAITGSVGKTSTKEAIFEVLKVKFGAGIRKSEGNLNNETGVPLAILGFQKSPRNFFQWLPIILASKIRALFGKKYQILVLEMAADKPGDIKYLTSFARPKIAILTSIGPAHLEAFETVEKIIDEKTELLQALPQDGLAVLNIDQEQIKKIAQENSGQTITYAIDEEADIMARNITTEINNFTPLTKFQILSEKGKFRASIQTLGRTWNVYSALAAIAVGLIMEMSIQDLIKGLANIRPQKHRLEVISGKEGSVILDDSYNANPLSMKAALETLKALPLPPAPARKIAVLGDMLEIGKITNEAHKLLGDYAKEIADEVISVGKLAKMYETKIHFNEPEEASDYLLGKIQQDDIILVKASRALGLEKIVEALKK